jgi:hypothetical protein
VAFDGASSLVAWQDHRSGSTFDIYCARVTPAGAVTDSGLAVKQEGDQVGPALARWSGNQMFLTYEGWAGTVGGKTYNTSRIWGTFGPFPGVQETPNAEVRTPKPLPTIVRGVLWLSPATSRKPRASSWLLDIDGRQVMALRHGANDVSRLAPGVYFVRSMPSTTTVRKVILTR